jgi:hypothetical protein
MVKTKEGKKQIERADLEEDYFDEDDDGYELYKQRNKDQKPKFKEEVKELFGKAKDLGKNVSVLIH